MSKLDQQYPGATHLAGVFKTLCNCIEDEFQKDGELFKGLLNVFMKMRQVSYSRGQNTQVRAWDWGPRE